LNSGTFSALALARHSARFFRNVASFDLIFSRTPAGAVVRSGFIPVTGAVALLLVGGLSQTRRRNSEHRGQAGRKEKRGAFHIELPCNAHPIAERPTA
jgi:hypothetical protein